MFPSDVHVTIVSTAVGLAAITRSSDADGMRFDAVMRPSATINVCCLQRHQPANAITSRESGLWYTLQKTRDIILITPDSSNNYYCACNFVPVEKHLGDHKCMFDWL